MKRNLKKIKRFFDKFGNVAGYAKRTIYCFAVQSDAPKSKQILSAIASFTAFGARRAGAWLDFEGIATPTENSAFGQKAWRPPKPRPWHLLRRDAFYRDTNFIFDRFCYHLARLKFIFVRI